MGNDRPDTGNTGNINRGAEGSLATADEARGRASSQYAWASGVGDEQIGMARNAATSDFGIADQSNANAAEAWNSYRTTFMPVQDKMVSDAMNYDSPEQMERVRQSAAGSANSAWDTAMASRDLGLEHMGVNPNSARFADPNATSLARAGSVAGAMNQATTNRQDTAIGLREGVAGFGMNVAQLGNQNYGLAVNSRAAGVAGMNSAVAGASAARTAPAAWTGAAISGYNGGAGALTNLANANTAAFNATTGRYAGMETERHQMSQDAAQWVSMGMGGGASSDENVKEEKFAVDADLILAGLERIPVQAWKYKDGVADSGRHIGPMAQDVHREFGARAAPDGKRIDFISMHGLALAAIQALSKKIDRLSVGLAAVGA